MSCGIDSMYMLKRHWKSDFPQHDLTHLAIFNIGAFSNGSQFAWQRQRAQKVASMVNMPLVSVDSNFSSVFNENHVLSNSFRNLSLVLLLQKLFGRYYLSSTGYGIKSFSIEDNEKRDSAYYDVLTCECLSSHRLQIHSDGAVATRLEKSKEICDFPIAQEYLHVCVADQGDNCGICPKCKRALLTFDALGVLDNFKEVLPIEDYKAKRNKYCGYMVGQLLLGNAGDHFMPEIHAHFKHGKGFLPFVLGCYFAMRSTLAKSVLLRKIYTKLFG